MTEEWSDWVEHDGFRPECPSGRIEVVFPDRGIGLRLGAQINYDWPGWYWRWRSVRTGWFKSERRRMCDDPAYAPIIRYRYRKPSGLAMLERIAANPDRAIERTDRENAD